MPNTPFDVCIRGTGIVAQALALKLGQLKLRVALLEPEPPNSDGSQARDVRAYALNHASRTLLEHIRCWPEGPAATAVARMHVFGDAGGAVRFDATTPGHASTPSGGQALAWIVDVPALEDQLQQALRYQACVERVSAPVEATLTAICEGKFSSSRDALGITVENHAYPQHAIAVRVRASEPHRSTASQWFSGPHILGLLPLDGPEGDTYALVWSTSTAQADRLMALDDVAFAEEMRAIIAHPSHTVDAGDAVGPATTFALTSARARWPLRLTKAREWTGPMPHSPEHAWVLLGDSAHTVHPLAGSGLNLGLGDVAALSHVLQHRPAWRSIADRRLLRSYVRERKAALLPYVLATDGLQWLFWQDQPWLQTLRNWGMRGFAASPLRSCAIHHARQA